MSEAGEDQSEMVELDDLDPQTEELIRTSAVALDLDPQELIRRAVVDYVRRTPATPRDGDWREVCEKLHPGRSCQQFDAGLQLYFGQRHIPGGEFPEP